MVGDLDKEGDIVLVYCIVVGIDVPDNVFVNGWDDGIPVKDLVRVRLLVCVIDMDRVFCWVVGRDDKDLVIVKDLVRVRLLVRVKDLV